MRDARMAHMPVVLQVHLELQLTLDLLICLRLFVRQSHFFYSMLCRVSLALPMAPSAAKSFRIVVVV